MARLAGVSLCSVKRIAEEVPVVHVDDAAEREKRRIGRPSIVENFRKLVVKILEEKPDLPSLEILRRVREAGYQGGKTALYALVASVRPKQIKPLIRFEGLPGEFSQHDFGEVDVTFLDGSTHRIQFFASRLKYSRFICVSVVKDQAVESLVRNLAEHLDRWGGAPLMCVFDRPKTVALKWQRNGEVTEWNPVFAYVMLELGVGVELCWPHSPQQKGAVENLVGFVKSSFFKVRRFHDQEDLAQQLIEWHREVNQERACRATGIIPAVRLAEEASRLRSLKVHPKDLALRIPVYQYRHTHHTHYQIACTYAVLGQPGKAFEWLERTIEGGFACWPMFQRDPCLKTLHDSSEFRATITRLEHEFPMQLDGSVLKST